MISYDMQEVKIMKTDDNKKNIITATELKQNLGLYLEEAINNKEFVITKNGSKAARLSPYLTSYERYLSLKEESLDYKYDKKRVSYEEFMEIYNNSDLRMEFINGEIIVLGSPSTFHQDISGNLYMIIKMYLKGKKCKVYYAPFDVHFYKRNIEEPDVCQPDLLIACDTDTAITKEDRYMGTPSLVVEILSKGTRSKDMVDKLNTYMLSGVKEFLIVDPDARKLIQYSFDDCEIDDYKIYKEEEAFESEYFEGLKFEMREIFEA